jgi:hypothetical protein
MSNVPTLKKLITGEVSMADTINFIEAKVVEQGGPAVNDGSCVYLTKDGLKCGIGHLITPEDHEEANHKFDGTIYTILTQFPSVFGIDANADVDELFDGDTRITDIAIVLSMVQKAHDQPFVYNALVIPKNYIEIFQKKMSEVRENYSDLITKIDGGKY